MIGWFLRLFRRKPKFVTYTEQAPTASAVDMVQQVKAAADKPLTDEEAQRRYELARRMMHEREERIASRERARVLARAAAEAAELQRRTSSHDMYTPFIAGAALGYIAGNAAPAAAAAVTRDEPVRAGGGDFGGGGASASWDDAPSRSSSYSSYDSGSSSSYDSGGGGGGGSSGGGGD